MSKANAGKNKGGRTNKPGGRPAAKKTTPGSGAAKKTTPGGSTAVKKAGAGGRGGKPPVNPLTEKKRWRPSVGLVVVVVLLLALGTGVGVQYWRSNSGVNVDTNGAVEPPMITGPGTSGKGVTVGKQGAKTQIDLYLDYRCPHCKDFEEEAGPTIDKLVDDGVATVTYNPMTFVNKDASPRLANGFACAAAAGKARTYNDQLYADYAKAWSNDQLVELGKELGITDPGFEQCVRGNSQAGWLDSVAKAAEARGVNETPTVFMNGKKLSEDQLTPEGVQAAASGSSS